MASREFFRLASGQRSIPMHNLADLSRLIDFSIRRDRADRRARNEYDAGNTGRLRNDWGYTSDVPYNELASKQEIMRSRSRDLYKNDYTYRAAINTVVQNAVGTGITPKPKVKINGVDRPDINKSIEENFWLYCRRNQWDARQKSAWIGEGQRMALRTILVSGDVLLNKVPSKPGRLLPVAWQMFEADRLDNSKDVFTRNNYMSENVSQTMHGINIDAYGNPVSYWIKGIDKAISASNIIHSYPIDRPEQYIGLPSAVAALEAIFDKHDLLEDFVLKSRAIAKILNFLSNKNDKVPGTEDVSVDDFLKLEALSTMRGDEPPQDVKFPDNVNDTVAPLVRILEHGICSSLGTSYTTVTRNMDGVNFAASKFISIQEWAFNKMLRSWFVEDHCDPFYERAIEMMIVTGKIKGVTSDQYAKSPADYTYAEWTAVGKEDVDPEKDMNSDINGLKTGILSFADICARRGKDKAEQIETLKQEKKEFEDNGLPVLLGSELQPPSVEPVNPDNSSNPAAPKTKRSDVYEMV